MPDPESDRLESLLATVLPLLAVHGESRTAGPSAPALPIAEAALLITLLDIGEVTQQQLADRLHLDKSRVSRLCLALERKRLVIRERDQANRRNLLVNINDAGTAAALRLRQQWREWHEQVLAAITPSERHALLTGLAALARELPALRQRHEAAR